MFSVHRHRCTVGESSPLSLSLKAKSSTKHLHVCIKANLKLYAMMSSTQVVFSKTRQRPRTMHFLVWVWPVCTTMPTSQMRQCFGSGPKDMAIELWVLFMPCGPCCVV